MFRRAPYASDKTWLESTELNHTSRMTAYQSQEQWRSLFLQRRRQDKWCKGKCHQEPVVVCIMRHMQSIGFI